MTLGLNPGGVCAKATPATSSKESAKNNIVRIYLKELVERKPLGWGEKTPYVPSPPRPSDQNVLGC